MIQANGRPDAALTPEWMPGPYNQPYPLKLPVWRRWPWPHVGWWTRWKTAPVQPGGVY